MLPGTTYNIKLNNNQLKGNMFQNRKQEQILLIGPWIGEFGWELFCWQGHIRRISKNYKKVVVISRPGHKFLYQDFCDEFIEFKTPLNAVVDSWRCSGIDNNKIRNLTKNIRHDVKLSPVNIGFLIFGDGRMQLSENFKNQEFIKYKSNSLEKHFDILIHPRNRKVGNLRNWNKDKWEILVNKLSNDYKIATIGTNESIHIEGTEDLRNISIEDTVSVMNRTKLVVGPSSGPMHLASLSGAPHLVWSEAYNKNRYLIAWNPFKTPVVFYDKENWNPSVNNIYSKIIEILK